MDGGQHVVHHYLCHEPATFYVEVGSQVKIMWSTATDNLLTTGNMSNSLLVNYSDLQAIFNHEVTAYPD